MAYAKASTDDVESVVPEEYGGMWFLRDVLGAQRLGVTLMELAPGGKGKRHDHADEDHEEIYLVLDGELTVELGEQGDPDTVTVGPEEALRVDPGTTRQLFNRGESDARLVIAGAP